MDDAFKAFADVQAVTEIGVLRAQYSAKLAELMPRVQGFVKAPGDDWSDTKVLMREALRFYQPESSECPGRQHLRTSA
jgi:hypothetical protein